MLGWRRPFHFPGWVERYGETTRIVICTGQSANEQRGVYLGWTRSFDKHLGARPMTRGFRSASLLLLPGSFERTPSCTVKTGQERTRLLIALGYNLAVARSWLATSSRRFLGAGGRKRLFLGRSKCNTGQILRHLVRARGYVVRHLNEPVDLGKGAVSNAMFALSIEVVMGGEGRSIIASSSSTPKFPSASPWCNVRRRSSP